MVEGTVEQRGKEFFVVSGDGKARKVAKAHTETAAGLVGQFVTGEFTPAGVVDLVAAANMVEAAAEYTGEHAVTAGPSEFFNPYTFIPAPPRRTTGTEFGDGPGCGHDRYHDDRWSGRIRVNLELRSPLLITDAGAARWEGAHGIFPTRSHRHGEHDQEPIVPASSVKGMLRAAFEAVTASRFGLFDAKHATRLAFRQQASQALRMVPARVTDDGTALELLTGTTTPGDDGTVPNGKPQYAAWLPAYRNPPWLTLADLGLTQDGPLPPLRLEVKIRLARKDGRRPFDYWQVVEVLKFQHDGEMRTPRRTLQTDQASTGTWVSRQTRVVTGWLHWTNQNFSRKHDERVFFSGMDAPATRVALDDELLATWNAAVHSSVNAHRPQEVTGRNQANNQPWKYLGNQPGKTAWSPHVYQATRQELRAGSLCYATVKRTRNGFEALSLHPVMIGREPFAASPRDLAEAARIEPARSFDEFSPADRVFGWVNAAKGDDQATRGHLRVGFVEPLKATISEFNGNGVPLAILSGPKPTQARFYAARDLSGQPPDDGSDKSAGYQRDGGLRGRKVYPPHQLDRQYWDDPANPNGGREYCRARGTRDDQNRSVTSWVDVGSQFAFDLWIDNLSDAELGALLHVLCLDDQACLRLGAARPLGLGSVHLSVDWDATSLPLPNRLVDRYRSLTSPHRCERDEILAQVQPAFSGALLEVIGAEGTKKVLEAFQVAVHGGEGPVHYPRAAREPDPAGKNYDWFTRNEKQQGGRIAQGRGKALPSPYGPLPFYKD